MASLKRMEKMRQILEQWGMETEPKWILRTDGEPGHISGQLRELSDEIWDSSHDDQMASILISEAAEQIDDAHEDWLEAQNPAAFKGML